MLNRRQITSLFGFGENPRHGPKAEFVAAGLGGTGTTRAERTRSALKHTPTTEKALGESGSACAPFCPRTSCAHAAGHPGALAFPALSAMPRSSEVELDQRPGDPELRGAGLARGPTTGGVDQEHRNFYPGRFRYSQQRLAHRSALRGFVGEVPFEGTPVDGDLALAGPQKHSRHRSLAAARAYMLYKSHSLLVSY